MQTRILLFFLTALALSANPTLSVHAESPDRIANLSISVWPEYDDPSVLVIYDGEFADKTGFPRLVAFLVPSGARINATAYTDSKGDYLNTDPWKTEDAGNGLMRVIFTLPAPGFQVEYYYNPLQGAPNKTMDFVYTSAHTVDQVQLRVQEPLKSSDFKTNPAAALQTAGGHDFKYHVFQFTNLAIGQKLQVQISYTKTDPNPSIANITAPQPAPPGETATSWSLILPVALGATGLALGTLGFFAWRARRSEEEAETTPRPRRRKKRTPVGAAAFCHECGNALRSDDLFCSKCGTRRK